MFKGIVTIIILIPKLMINNYDQLASSQSKLSNVVSFWSLHPIRSYHVFAVLRNTPTHSSETGWPLTCYGMNKNKKRNSPVYSDATTPWPSFGRHALTLLEMGSLVSFWNTSSGCPIPARDDTQTIYTQIFVYLYLFIHLSTCLPVCLSIRTYTQHENKWQRISPLNPTLSW